MSPCNERGDMATVFEVDGSRRTVLPATPPAFTLEELQSLVGGPIELVTLYDDTLFFINEEGKLRNLPYNEQATRYVADRLLPGDYIVGPAVLMSEQEAGE